jgi:hypothetical protein
MTKKNLIKTKRKLNQKRNSISLIRLSVSRQSLTIRERIIFKEKFALLWVMRI